MPPSIRNSVLAATIALACATAATADDTATIYQWTDSKGTTRYTPDLDRVPVGSRDTVVTIVEEDPGPGDSPAYFEPDPRADDVRVPEPETGKPAGTAPPLDDTARARIRELEAEIAQHEDALKAYISQPGTPGDDEIPPELREIAEQLPALQAELAALKQRPESAGAP